MMRRAVFFAVLVAISVPVMSACDVLSSLTKPSGNTTTTTQNASEVLNGTWATTQSLPGSTGSLANSCVNFNWTVTQFSGSSGSGTFSATCLGNVAVAGSASGSLNGNSITWSANATATVPNVSSCPISLSGTATLEANNRIRIPYAGTTCLGPVSGTEVIQK